MSENHEVICVPETRRVRVRIGDTVLADTTSPVALHETGLPVRWYIPPGDVAMELLAPTATSTVCPYKGTASYWSAAGVDDVAWAYLEPIPGAEAIRGHLSFYDSKVTVEVAP